MDVESGTWDNSDDKRIYSTILVWRLKSTSTSREMYNQNRNKDVNNMLLKVVDSRFKYTKYFN